MVTLLSFGGLLSTQPASRQLGLSQMRRYYLSVTTRYNNFTSSYFGTQELILNTSSLRTYNGYITWNLSWDNGNTWVYDSAWITYAWNRSYQFAGHSLYTGWWIPPALQIGAQIRIDGDTPATNTLLRTAPFIVTDLVSIPLNDTYYLCWQLSYSSDSPQYETYYYEFHTGVLVHASSQLWSANLPIHEVEISLLSSWPNLPTISILFHYWFNTHTLILALIGASLTTVFVYYLLQHFVPPPRKIDEMMEIRQNA